MNTQQFELRQTILKSLEPLYREAKARGLWFLSKYQGMIFSPDELMEQQNRGKLIWGLTNWELVDPRDILEAKKKAVLKANDEVIAFEKRMGVRG